MNCLKCFLGGSSPTGFRTRFGEKIADTDYRTYIIKGGPGTGKSSLMKRLAEAFPDEKKEVYHCSSDPDSLDAVVFEERRVIFVDGTAPHTFDPEYPGAVQQILDLGAYWDSAKLRKSKEEIISVTKDYLQHHGRCRRCISALAAVIGDCCQIGRLALNEEKLDGFISRLAKKVIPKKTAAEEGKITFRQLSALTPKGYITYIPDDYTVYMLNDGLYSGSEMFLRRFSDIAAKKGFDVSVSLCTLHNGEFFEHILIPELKLAFMSASPLNELCVAQKQPVNFKRFYDKNTLSGKKTRIKFNDAAVKSLRDEACTSLVNAKAEHDKLEQFYIKSVDFDSINRLYYSLISEIKSL